jgi:hypothetical protein
MKKSIFYLMLAGLLIIIVIMFALTRQTPNSPPLEPALSATPQPTIHYPTLTPYPEVPETVITPMVEILPFENEQFLVEYLPKTREFYVSVKPELGKQNYAAALVWLTQQGIPSPENNAQVRFLYLESY